MTKDEALKQALEALKKGKEVREGGGGTMVQPVLEDAAITAIKAALAQPEPEQEPIKWEPSEEWLDIAVDAAMAQQEKELQKWVGLTDTEIKRIGDLDVDSNYFGLWYDFAKAIEAKLKEKNNV
jgi:hypothetical protein